MFHRLVPRPALLALALALSVSAAAEPVGSAFTYQGELRSSGAPSSGPHDFQVVLYDAQSGGAEIAAADIADAPVDQGLFSLPLDFTGVPFEAGLQYWIELRVRGGAESGAYTTLLPRQRLTATPYALNALSVRAGSVGSDEIDAGQVQRRIAGTCGAAGQSIKSIAADGSVTCETDDSGPPGTIEGVTAGSGLAGGGTSGTVTLSIAPGGVGAAQIDEASVQRRVAGQCAASGESIKSIAADGSVTCETDDVGAGTITGVTAGNGLSGGGSSGDVALGIAAGGVGADEVDPFAVQLRVTGECPLGASIRSIDAAGAVSCEPDNGSNGDITGVTAGFGLTGGGTTSDVTLAVNPAVMQQRVLNNCPAGQAIRAIGADGGVICEVDDAPGALSGWQIVTDTEVLYGGSAGTGDAAGEARCPTGKRVIGGGVNANCTGAYVTESRPTDIPGTFTTSGWWAHVVKPSGMVCGANPVTVTIYAICAKID